MKIRYILTLLLVVCTTTLFAAKNDINNLLPQPQQLEWGSGLFKSSNVKLIGGEGVDFVAEQCEILGLEISDESSSILEITLVDDIDAARLNQDEAYTLDVTKKKIAITATSSKGVYWAFQTLRQLVVESGKTTSISTCQITDWPAFRIRGFMQDVGRTYISVEELKREIEILSRYKINVFHWHLTENQSWRLESKIFPMLNDSINTTRMPGQYYTIEEAKELVAFCKAHNVTLIPELDMPGHSAAFQRTFRHDMQSPEGMKILKLLVEEACETLDVPYLHIGTDEVHITNPNFVPEMVAFVRSLGKKVISWNPGSHYEVGDIDMTHLWSSFGKAQEGIPTIDSKYHYLNHYDIFADIVSLYNSKVYNHTEGSDDIAGAILAIWNDRIVTPEQNIVLENNLYSNMLALAERTWLGGGTEYYDVKGTNLDTTSTPEFEAFVDFERRMLHQKSENFDGYPFAYVKQTNVKWHITDAFPNGGDLTKVFPPEQELSDSYSYDGEDYGVRSAVGAGIYLRHVWGTFIPTFFENPQPNHTAYAYTWVYSPKEQEVGMLLGFQNYSRSEKDLAPAEGKWDYKESRAWLNDKELLPPVWTGNRGEKTPETPLGNMNVETRSPIMVTLNKGWNKVFLKLPVANFSSNNVRLEKWMFTAVFVTADGRDAVDGLIYSPEKIK